LIPGNWHELVFHERLGQIVLLNGGPEQGKPASDPLEVWGWTGRGWDLLSVDPTGPAWRNFAAAAYDSARGVLVLFGGLQTPDVNFEETWEWDGAAWTRHDVPGPGAREGPGMTYDAVRQRVVLFGGAQGGRVLSDTWTWDGATWAQLSEAGPAPRYPGGFAFDAVRGRVLLFGGHEVTPSQFNTYGDTWEWDGAAWTQASSVGPTPRDGARAAFDAQRGQVVLFGGIQIEPAIRFLDDTWVWDGVTWAAAAGSGPPGRGHHAMAYDPIGERVLVFGGSDGPGPSLRRDTWAWDGQAWECLDACE
jgi:hypothetical protein